MSVDKRKTLSLDEEMNLLINTNISPKTCDKTVDVAKPRRQCTAFTRASVIQYKKNIHKNGCETF